MLESKFQANLVKELKSLLPGCYVLKSDPSHIQGIPDLLILYKNKWAALESKGSENAKKQPNQEYHVQKLGEMSFASFICPENKQEVLNELQQSLSPRRKTRLPKCK